MERDYWKYILELNEKLKIKKALEQTGQEDSSFSPKRWLEENKDEYLIKVDFTKDDLFDFEEAKITKMQRDLWKRSANMLISSKYDSLIYQMFVFKEFVIQTTLYPNSHLELQKAGYKEKLMGLLNLLKDEVDIGLNNEIGQMQTDLENALSQQKYTHRIFIPAHRRYEIEDKNYKVELEKILSKLSTKHVKKKKNERKRPPYRPLSATDLNKLVFFAEILEKRQAGKLKITLSSAKKNVTKKFKIDHKTIPSWLERRLKFLPEKKDIEDLTVEDVKYLWENHQKLK